MNYERPRRTPAEQAALDATEKRQFWRIAVMVTIAIVTMTGIYVFVADAVRPPSPETGAAAQRDNPALPMPDGGHEPTDSGDRGGAEQLFLMGGLFVVLAGGAAWVVHSSRRTRRRLADKGTEANGATGPGETPGTEGEIRLSAGSPEPR